MGDASHRWRRALCFPPEIKEYNSMTISKRSLIILAIIILFAFAFNGWMRYQEFRIKRCDALCGNTAGCIQRCLDISASEDFPK